MLDIKFLSENLDYCKERLAMRNGKFDVDEAISLNNERKSIIGESEVLKAAKNKVSQEVALLKKNKENADSQIARMQEVNLSIKALDQRLSEVEGNLKEVMMKVPNIPDDSTPLGKDDSQNVEIRKVGTPKVFDFAPKAHWDIGEERNILDFKTAGKISGARFTYYRGLGARLERSIISLMMDTHAAKGYEEVIPPYLVNTESMVGTGQLPKFAEDMFHIENTNLYLIPTAEVPVTNMYRGDILNGDDLTLKYCAYSACFRAEAGSAGRDTRGVIRQHQFNKVELVKFTTPESSMAELEALTSDAEDILKLLEIPYRVVLLCSGDVGFSSSKTYDIEVWMPSYGKYVEISSCSNFKDFQARRANIRYRDKDGKLNFVHTLNGSGLAVGRTLAAILENYQNADGTVSVPSVLRKYMNVDKI